MSVYQGEDVTAVRADGIATISLARPPVNAMRTQTWVEFGEALSAVVAATGVNVLVIRSGVAGIFSAGADVRELPMTPAQDEHRRRLTSTALAELGRHPVPVIAAIDGAAVGGACAIAAQADIRIGTARARFAIPEIDVGRCGGTRHLRRHLDAGTVRWMAFTGGWLDAAQAGARGLLTWVVDDLEPALTDLAGRIAAKSPAALRLTKQSIAESDSSTPTRATRSSRSTASAWRGRPTPPRRAAAFAEKRTPQWSNL